MRTSEQTKNIMTALNSLPVFEIHKNADNPYFKSKYADLPEILKIIQPELKKVGLVLIQSAPMTDNVINVITRLMHTSGEWIEIDCCVPADKSGKLDAQTAGSAITYGRRYGINALLSLSAEDDDGNKASGKADKDDTIKLESLPDDIKQSFRLLKYSRKAVYDFCIRLGFNHDKIRTALVPLTLTEGLPEGFNGDN
jgi:hypothetical protein